MNKDKIKDEFSRAVDAVFERVRHEELKLDEIRSATLAQGEVFSELRKECDAVRADIQKEKKDFLLKQELLEEKLKDWRMGNEKKGMGANAPHTDKKFNKAGYSCNFERIVASYNLHPLLMNRNQEYQQDKVMWCKEAAQDGIAVIIKK